MTSVAEALDLYRQGCAAIASIDRTACGIDELSRLVVGVGRLSDRLRAIHALHVQQADRAAVWMSSGSRNVTGWYADRMAVGFGDAQRVVKLGDVLEASDRVLDAVLSGRLSAATAESLHAAIVQGPEGADRDEFLDTLLGPRPATNPAADPATDGAGGDDAPTDAPGADDTAGTDDAPAADPESRPGEPAGFGPEAHDLARGAAPGPAPKDARQAAEDWKQSHTDPAELVERIRAKRSVSAGSPVDGVITSTVVLPVLEHRQFLDALDHIVGRPTDGDERTLAQRRADGLTELCRAYAAGSITGGREHPKVIVTIDIDSFLGDADRPGITSKNDHIPAAVVRHLAERAELRWMLHTGTEILQLGRSQRLASDAQYEALVARDGGCRFPGCTIPATWCEADHLVDWIAGGRTDIDWLVLWCDHHHHVRHRAGVRILGDANDLTLVLPSGDHVPCPPRGLRRRRPGRPPGDLGNPSPDPDAARGPTSDAPAQSELFALA